MAYLQIDGYTGASATVTICPVADPTNCYTISPLTNVGYLTQVFPVLIPLPSQFDSSYLVNVTVADINGCNNYFANVACGTVPTPTPTPPVDCKCTQVELRPTLSPPWTIDYVDCSGNTTSYTENTLTIVSLCNISIDYSSGDYTELATTTNCSFNGTYYECPSPTPTPTSVTPTPTPTQPGGLAAFTMTASGVNAVAYRIVFTSGSATVDFGDGNVSALTSGVQVVHTYGAPYSGNITVSGTSVVPNVIDNFVSFQWSAANHSVSANTSQLKVMQKITKISPFSLNTPQNYIFGDFAEMSACTSLQVLDSQANSVSGSINSISANTQLLWFNLVSGSSLSGNIGAISGLTALGGFAVGGTNTITGNVSQLAGLSTTYGFFTVAGNNTLSGLLQDLPNANNLYITGNNTLSGNINAMGPTTQNITIGGSNTISGNTSAFSSSNLLSVNIGGANTISGDISGITSSTLISLILQGNNTVTGSLQNYTSPGSLTTFRVEGFNTLSGNINRFNSGATPQLNTLYIAGSNTVTGSISALTNSITTLRIQSNGNTISGPGIPHSWGNALTELYLYTTSGTHMSSTDVDNLFIDINNDVTNATIARTVNITGTHAAPTAASSAARTALTTTKNFTITTN